MSGRVFMIMPHGDDVSDARRFGALEYIFGDERRPRIWSPEFVEEALSRLEEKQYDPSADYILITGAMIPVVRIASAIAHQSEVPPLALFWDKAIGEYVSMRLGVEQVRS